MDILKSIMTTSDIDTKQAIYIFSIIIVIWVFIIIWYIYAPSNSCSIVNKNTYITNISNGTSSTFINPLQKYYIMGAYNCCSLGTYKNGYVNTCMLLNVLKQGCRCLDFEIYSLNNVPVIATSIESTYDTKETYNYINFSEAMNIISNNAFSSTTCPNYTDPLILNFRMKSSNPTMYNNLATILAFYNKDKLFSRDNITTISLKKLNNKIIVISDNKNNYQDTHFNEFVNINSGSSNLRTLRYYDINNSADNSELVKFNKKYITIVLPDIGSDPLNPNLDVCMKTGCQIIMSRFQKHDNTFNKYMNYFNQHNYAFVKK